MNGNTPTFDIALVAQPAIVELAEEISARGRQIVALSAEVTRLTSEAASSAEEIKRLSAEVERLKAEAAVPASPPEED